jgi:type II secretory pathway pseudopilin PulG
MDFAEGVQTRSSADAFTRLELIAVLTTIGVLALTLLPLLGNTSGRSDQISCLNNLRQIGIAFQAWGNDHDDRRPAFVPMNEGGGAAHPLRDNAYFHFMFLSNYLSSPTLLIDPAEATRTKRVASTWDFSPNGGFLNPAFRNNALSYLLGCHTTRSETRDVLSGDRNLQFGGLAGCSYGFSQVWFLNVAPQSFRGWTNGPHGTAGNLLINDGHVEFTSQDRLQAVLTHIEDFSVSDHFLSPL